MDPQVTFPFSKVLEVVVDILKKPKWEDNLKNKESVQTYLDEYLQKQDANVAIFEEAMELLRKLPEQVSNLTAKYESPVVRSQDPLPASLLEEVKAQLKSKKLEGRDMLIPPEPLDEDISNEDDSDENNNDMEWLIEEAASKQDFWDEACQENWKLGLKCKECGKNVDGKHLYVQSSQSIEIHDEQVYCDECVKLESTPSCLKICGSKYMVQQANEHLKRCLRNGQVLLRKHQVQGVDDFLPAELHDLFVKEMDHLAEVSKHDFHPGTKGKVMNLIHPSMYPYIIGQSKLVDGMDVPNTPSKCRGEPTATYQWLPAEVSVDEEGMCQFTSYINNLFPDVHPNLYSLLGLIFSYVLPLFEGCLDKSLKGKNLQVVVKACDYILEPGHSYSGNFHLVGTKQEHIVASGIYYYDMTEGIVDDGLAFRRPRDDVTDWPQNENDIDEFKSILYGNCIAVYNKLEREPGSETKYAGQELSLALDSLDDKLTFDECLVSLGHVASQRKRCVVFTNNIQHKVTGIHVPKTAQGTQRCRVLCFHLVNPDQRIASSKAVAPQQQRCKKEEMVSTLQSVNTHSRALPLEVCEEIHKIASVGMPLKEALEERFKCMHDRGIASDFRNSRFETLFHGW